MAIDLKQRRLELGLSMRQIADFVGVAEATVSRWESGNIENMKRQYIKKYADALHISPLDILGLPQTRAETMRIPVYASVSAGTGAFADGNIDGYLTLPYEQGEFFALRVRGESMLPEIHDNDTIIVKRGSEPRDGQIVVAIVNGDEGFCKRFMRSDSGIGLLSDNPACKSFFFTNKEINSKPVRIIGTVEQLIRRL